MADGSKSYSAVDALDVFATLALLFLNFGGSIPEFLNHRAVWFFSQVGAVPATLTSPARDVIEPTKDYWLDMAALAAELKKQLSNMLMTISIPPILPLRADHSVVMATKLIQC
jgi:hypothetical protein